MLEERLGDPDVAVLYARLLTELTNSSRERTGMLATLIGMLLGDEFTLEEKSRLLRVAESLEPWDVIALQDLILSDGLGVYIRARDGETTEDALRRIFDRQDHKSPYSHDALLLAGCIAIGEVNQFAGTYLPSTHVTVLGRTFAKALSSWKPVTAELRAIVEAYAAYRTETSREGF